MTGLSKWKTIGYAVAIFAAGGISGGALGVYETKSGLMGQRDQEVAGRIMRRLQTRLALTPDQVGKITPIVQGAASDIHAIRRQSIQRIITVLDTAYGQISAVLTPDQRVKLDQMQKERREMMQRWQEGGHRHPGTGDGTPSPQQSQAPSPA